MTSLRRRVISKICALFFIGLILTPFTAPFKSYELASSQSDQSHEGLIKDKIGSDEKLVGPSDESSIPPALNAIVVSVFSRPNQVDDHPPQATILRI